MSLLRPQAGSRVKLSDMNMTPLIDCVFLLVLFFMVGMQFRQEDRQLEARLRAAGPPRPPEERQPPDPELWVEIHRGGTAAAPSPRVLIDHAPMRSWDAAEAYLRDYARIPGATKIRIVVAPSDDAVHAWVMHALDLLKQTGYENVGFKR
ncbi:MAG TPA: biopolymer transporter ExbD [Planctomycetota bacterium]|nr:biopolymer transporter ExbD [Planctomycetota bacterium]